jgi:transposase-like protein
MELSSFSALSAVQARVALSLASGASISSAAASTGVGRTAIYSWLKNDSSFADAVKIAKAEFVLTLRDQLRDASAKALITVTGILDDPKAPAGVRLRAALAILTRPQFPEAGWNLPEKALDPTGEQILASQILKRSANSSNTAKQIRTIPNNKTQIPDAQNQPPMAPGFDLEAMF